MKNYTAISRSCLLGIPLILVACAGPGQQSKASTGPEGGAPTQAGGSAGEQAPRQRPLTVEATPWTSKFMQRSLLLADEISITGPVGLMDHCVMTLDDALFERTELPTPDGLQLILRPRPGTGGEDLLRAQIDAWNLAAYKEIRMDLRAGDTEVVVTARGSAVWQNTDGSEQRASHLMFSGSVQGASVDQINRQ